VSPARLLHLPSEVTELALSVKREGGRVGVVPTMGCLHEGHLSLVRAAAAECDHVITTVFVNPTQFGPGEDFERYPRTLGNDVRLAEAAGTHTVFAPETAAMYAADHATTVEVAGLTSGLCGASRPGHFKGVTTIVAMLLNVTQADAAYFGRKDAQQAAVIRRMVRDLHFPVRVAVLPTVREPDGLAMSSRNAYLSAEERAQALGLVSALRRAAECWEAGERTAAGLCTAAADQLDAYAGFLAEYVALVHPDTMEPLQVIEGAEGVEGAGLLALAGRVGATRLIDNALFREGQAPQI